jgi:CheY-like chemotaxis protein
MSARERDSILLVDDEPHVLAALSRTLRGHFAVDCATSAADALGRINGGAAYAVIVSDMRMPGVDGIQFLAQARQRAPLSVRMMLTGNADQATAIEAVNEGNIFRFLTKPCAPELLIRTLRAGCRQYHLATAERELLERTLRGSVDVLIEMLSLLSPAAFGRSLRLRSYVQHMAAALDLEDMWQHELAAMLSQLGCISLSTDLLDKVNAGQPLTPVEQRLLASHPEVGQRLLAKIPRLETISQIVADQGRAYSAHPAPTATGPVDAVAVGAQMLHAAIAYDLQLTQGATPHSALASMHARAGEYNPRLLALLESFGGAAGTREVRALRLEELECGMVIHEDIRAANGMTLVAKRQIITQLVLERLRGFQEGIGVIEPVLVEMPGPADQIAGGESTGAATGRGGE